MGKFIVVVLAAVILFVFLRTAFPATAQATQPGETTAALQAQAASPCGTTYTVVFGDTMGEIAQRCQVNYTSLVAANPQITNPNLIFPGQVVNIPGSGSIPPTGSVNYTVVAGDTLFRIAQRYSTTVAALLAANPTITNANRIYPGQVITIPSGGSIPPTGAVTYVVRAGDTLSRIAVANGTTVNALLALNPSITNPNRIYPGQVLIIRQ